VEGIEAFGILRQSQDLIERLLVSDEIDLHQLLARGGQRNGRPFSDAGDGPVGVETEPLHVGDSEQE